MKGCNKMVKLRIVELEGQKWAVQKCRGFMGRWEYLQQNEDSTWSSYDAIVRYCLIESKEEAEQSLQEIIAMIKRNRKELKIVRVIKTVRV
jgi:hypothetical protein